MRHFAFLSFLIIPLFSFANANANEREIIVCIQNIDPDSHAYVVTQHDQWNKNWVVNTVIKPNETHCLKSKAKRSLRHYYFRYEQEIEGIDDLRLKRKHNICPQINRGDVKFLSVGHNKIKNEKFCLEENLPVEQIRTLANNFEYIEDSVAYKNMRHLTREK